MDCTRSFPLHRKLPNLPCRKLLTACLTDKKLPNLGQGLSSTECIRGANSPPHMATYCSIYHNSLCTLPIAAYAKTFSIMLTLVRMSGMRCSSSRCSSKVRQPAGDIWAVAQHCRRLYTDESIQQTHCAGLESYTQPNVHLGSVKVNDRSNMTYVRRRIT